MAADLLPDGLPVSTAPLPWSWLPPPSAAVALPSPRRDQYRLDCGGDRSEWRPLLHHEQCQSQEHSENVAMRVPKLEQTPNSDLALAVAAMGTPSDLHITARKRPALPLSFPSPPSLLSPNALPLPPTSVGLRAQPSTTRPASQTLIPPNAQSSTRRRSISERIRLLARLMPWNRQMTTCVLLEEARKYVKFLEAQLAALQCMPAESRFACPPPSSYAAAAPVLAGEADPAAAAACSGDVAAGAG